MSDDTVFIITNDAPEVYPVEDDTPVAVSDSGFSADWGRALRTISPQFFPEVDKTDFIAQYWVGDAQGNPVPSAGTVTGGDATLRTDLANPASGSALILHKMAGSGAYARTMRQWGVVGGLSDNNVMNWIDSNLDADLVAGTNTADLQAMLQNALNGFPKGLLELPGFEFLINSTLSLSSRSKFVLRANGATIKAKNGMTVGSNTQLLMVTGCTDFRIESLIVDGNRANRTPIETSSHLVHFTNCQRLTLSDTQANNATTDGFRFEAGDVSNTATYCRGFLLENCRTDNAYRNGVGVIDGWDFAFIGGSYTNTSGTAPQAGIDIESNNTSVDPGNRAGRFIGTRFEGNVGYGLQISAKDSPEAMEVNSCYFANCTAGGISIGCRTVINGGLFENFTGTSIGVNVTSNTGDAAVCIGTEFRTFGSSTSCVTASADGVKLLGCRFANIATNTLSGFTVIVDGCTVDTASGIAFNVLSGGLTTVVANNRVKGATLRAILVQSNNAKVVHNHCIDVGSVSGGYIQAEGSGNTVTHNTCEASTAQATTIGIRASQNATAVAFNTCINLHTTDPYFFSGIVSSTSVFAGFNSGGTANNPKKIRYGLAATSIATYAAPSGGTTVDSQARTSLAQLAADLADLRTQIRAPGVMS
jgi:hypothetical protein